MSQFHFDPATYLEMIRSEVPLYDDLQHRVARATASIDAADLLDLGTGTGETLAQVLPFHPVRAPSASTRATPCWPRPVCACSATTCGCWWPT